MNRIGCYVRGKLRRRLFAWFGASILMTGLVVAAVMSFVGPGGPQTWKREMERARTFIADGFERVWDTPVERDAFARTLSRDLEVDLEVDDAVGRPLARYGGRCQRGALHVLVTRGNARLGTVRLCAERHRGHGSWRFVAALTAAGAMLWAFSGRVARRLSAPLTELARVATDIGAGKLSSRVQLDRHQHGEVHALALVINDMAARIEKQIADQRELLAAVSHELRTPLARIRLLTELGRAHTPEAKAKLLDEIDREVVEIDALVGELLASSRVDFAALTPLELDAVEVAQRAMERAGVDASKLVVDPGTHTSFSGDPTLIARALANLMENAARHAGGVEVVRVSTRDGKIRFDVADRGPGLATGDEARIFQPFYQRASGSARDGGSLGLGLALVRRIAEAHGGSASAANREGGGACVGITLPRVAGGRTSA